MVPAASEHRHDFPHPLARQLVTAALEAVFLTPLAVASWWTDYLRFLATGEDDNAVTFVIATSDQVEGGRRASRVEDASAVPEPGVEVIVSLPESGAHAIGRVDHVDLSERVIYVDVDEDSRVWS